MEKTADLAAGDARVIIQTLRSAAYNAERDGKDRITEEDMEEGYEAIKEIKKKYELEKLTPHHKLIINILKECRELSSTVFYDRYRKEADKRGLKVKSHRSFNDCVSELIRLNYIKVERAKVKGNVKLFEAV